MARFALHLAAIAGLLASQLAAIPHAHGGCSDDAHTSGCHFHWSWFWGEAPHAHDHSHPHSAPQHPAGDEWAHPHDHDHDAVYCQSSAGDALVKQRDPAAAIEKVGGLPGNALAPDNYCAAGGQQTIWHPPDKVSHLSEFFLELRKLRI